MEFTLRPTGVAPVPPIPARRGVDSRENVGPGEMKRKRLRYLAAGTAAGLFFLGLGFGLRQYYLVVVGIILLGGALATLSMPLPLL